MTRRRRAARQLAAGITGSVLALTWLGAHLSASGDLAALQALAPLHP